MHKIKSQCRRLCRGLLIFREELHSLYNFFQHFLCMLCTSFLLHWQLHCFYMPSVSRPPCNNFKELSSVHWLLLQQVIQFCWKICNKFSLQAQLLIGHSQALPNRNNILFAFSEIIKLSSHANTQIHVGRKKKLKKRS